MNWPTWDQIHGVAERVITLGLAALLSFAVIKGWITTDQAKEYGVEYGPLVIGLVASIYAYRHNSPQTLAERTANIPNTTVITTPEIAAATPNQSNIISAATNETVAVPQKTTADLNREELARQGS